MPQWCVLPYTIVPTVSAEISTSGAPIAGESYTLMCSVTGVQSLNATTNFEWRKSDGRLVSSNAVLVFSSLFSSHEGRYTCDATVSSSYLENDFVLSAVKGFIVECKFIGNMICGLNGNATLIMCFSSLAVYSSYSVNWYILGWFLNCWRELHTYVFRHWSRVFKCNHKLWMEGQSWESCVIKCCSDIQPTSFFSWRTLYLPCYSQFTLYWEWISCICSGIFCCSK